MENALPNIETPNWEYSNHSNLLTNKLATLEETIISCLLQDNNLLPNIKLLPEDFIVYNGLFTFLTRCYEKWNCLDPVLITSQLKGNDRFKFMNVYFKLILLEPCLFNFEKYCDALKLYNIENAKAICQAKIIDSIMELSIKLNNREISIEEFKNEVSKIDNPS